MKYLTDARDIGAKLKDTVKNRIARHRLIVGFIIVFYIWNPVALMSHSKGVGRFLGKRGRAIRYAYIKERRGETFATLAEAGDTWKDLGSSFGKCFRDFNSLFN